ncbi:transmembrane emp24 domain-containing protein p24beta3 [Citrus sinensis]|uniref:Transmembrane emp24 domain-containing protein p24beta3 n=1 Tax=Citrus sinensis TaxID=2711 RepID=A0ACB8MJ39_CITSI|nr:transmembrane emp24 domain-containing protein p24beta3 [Citrus sinensis]KAH9785679.1 transmembrane emp24 domain-containing protein p24beta3 [Citrus sinensis]
MQVTCPDGSIVRALKGTSGDKFVFKAPRSGMYQFCFHNPTSTPEEVSFYIHIGHIPNEHDLAKDGQFEHLDPIYVRIAELREALETVSAEQRYLKALESRHRSTNESTRKRVVFYTVSEYLLLAGAGALQVMYIRRLFGKTAAYVVWGTCEIGLLSFFNCVIVYLQRNGHVPRDQIMPIDGHPITASVT